MSLGCKGFDSFLLFLSYLRFREGVEGVTGGEEGSGYGVFVFGLFWNRVGSWVLFS